MEEEMRRVLHFLEWKANWWMSQGTLRQGVSLELHEGCAAYAAKQADILLSLAMSFAQDWTPLLEGHGMKTVLWPEKLRVDAQIFAHPCQVLVEVDDEDFDDGFF